MRKRLKTVLWMFLLSVVTSAWSQNLQDNVTLARGTVDAGGGQSASGRFVLNGSIGQHDASTTTASGRDNFVAGGFWANARDDAQPLDDLIFANGFEPLNIFETP